MIKYEVKVNNTGTKSWWLNGELHREDGPAIERANGDKAWYLNGNLHCNYGPAIEKADGFTRYYLHGKRLTKEEWENRLKRPCSGKIVEIDGVKYKLVGV